MGEAGFGELAADGTKLGNWLLFPGELSAAVLGGGSCLFLRYPNEGIALSPGSGSASPQLPQEELPAAWAERTGLLTKLIGGGFPPERNPQPIHPAGKAAPSRGPPSPAPRLPGRRGSRICKLLTRTSCVGDGGFSIGEQTPPADAFTNRFIIAGEENETMWSRCAELKEEAGHLEADGNFLKGEYGRPLKDK